MPYSRPRYSSRARRYRRYYKGYYRGRYKSFYRRKYRFANGSSSARTRIKIPFTRYVTLGVPGGSTDGETKVLSAWADATNQTDSYPGGALTSQIYATYSALYDEVKCEGIKLKGTLLTSIDATHPAVTLVSTIDKKWTAADCNAAVPSPTTLAATPAAQRITYNNNSYGKFTRRIYATDLNEKTTFVDASPATGNINVAGAAKACTYLRAWYDVGNGFTAFSPAIILGIQLSAAPAAVVNYTFYVEGNLYLTFRNPKYGLSGANKAIAPTLPEATTSPLTRTDTTLVDIETMTS